MPRPSRAFLAINLRPSRANVAPSRDSAVALRFGRARGQKTAFSGEGARRGIKMGHQVGSSRRRVRQEGAPRGRVKTAGALRGGAKRVPPLDAPAVLTRPLGTPFLTHPPPWCPRLVPHLDAPSGAFSREGLFPTPGSFKRPRGPLKEPRSPLKGPRVL